MAVIVSVAAGVDRPILSCGADGAVTKEVSHILHPAADL